MAVSKAQQHSVNKYVAKNYDRINVTMAKGKREIIQQTAKAYGLSTNSYINAAIETATADAIISWKRAHEHIDDDKEGEHDVQE